MATLNEAKYRNVILYFAQHINNGTLGRLKLMKLLYYLDFDHFELNGSSITGDDYQHYPKGPYPVNALAVLDAMQQEQWITIEKRDVGYSHLMDMYVPLRPYDLSEFAPSERDMLIQVAEKWALHTGADMLRATHGEPPSGTLSPEGDGALCEQAWT